MKDTWKMFSTVRAKEFGSITRSKKEIGVSARDAKMGLLIKKKKKHKQKGGRQRANIPKHKLKSILLLEAN